MLARSKEVILALDSQHGIYRDRRKLRFAE
jgi:hypothetical protein